MIYSILYSSAIPSFPLLYSYAPVHALFLCVTDTISTLSLSSPSSIGYTNLFLSFCARVALPVFVRCVRCYVCYLRCCGLFLPFVRLAFHLYRIFTLLPRYVWPVTHVPTGRSLYSVARCTRLVNARRCARYVRHARVLILQRILLFTVGRYLRSRALRVWLPFCFYFCVPLFCLCDALAFVAGYRVARFTYPRLRLRLRRHCCTAFLAFVGYLPLY